MLGTRMIDEIAKAWGWAGIKPAKIVNENAFGNLLILDSDGRYWHLCPEELSCTVVANNDEEFEVLCDDNEFVLDWAMDKLVTMAKSKLGPLAVGTKYCLKIPAVCGGQYEEDNLATISLDQLVRFSGDIGFQIKDLPDRAKIVLRIVD